VPNLSLSLSAGGHFQFIRAALRLRVPLAWAAIAVAVAVAVAVVGLVVSFTGADLSGGSLANGGVNGGATHPLTGLCLIALAGCVLRAAHKAMWLIVNGSYRCFDCHFMCQHGASYGLESIEHDRICVGRRVPLRRGIWRDILWRLDWRVCLAQHGLCVPCHGVGI
jgi:hypothetical protein